MVIIKLLLIIMMFFGTCFSENIHILYTANINATLENCNCGKDPLGGIDRIKTFIDQFEKNHPLTLKIDGGNYFNSYKFTKLNNTVFKALPLLNYDILASGIHIFFEEKEFFQNYLTRFGNKVLISNSNLKTKKSISEELNGYRIIVFNYISPNTFLRNVKPDWLSLNNKIEVSQKNSNDIFILIYHGYREEAEQYIKENKDFDLVLLSHDQQEGVSFLEETTIVGSSSDGESIVIIEVSKKTDVPKFDVKYKKMDKFIESDKQVLELIKEFKKNTSQNNNGDV